LKTWFIGWLAFPALGEAPAPHGGATQAKLGVNVARYAYRPSFGLDLFYGIDANEFAARTNLQNLTGNL
jgi:hypothetical protein